MQERRKQERKSLMAYTQVYDLYGGLLIGYLADLNLLGAMVISEREIAQSTELTLAIELPELPGVTALRITIPARVAWHQPDLSPQYFNLGFEFKEVTEFQSKVIQAIIDNYQFRRDAPNYNIRPA
ncbi:MAG: PilZ domain-containing protein [Anaerolineales bacterium]|nr:PilZ domain-containing protein [Anaerolineales bacterium]MCZ2123248.1 PilZ domain-containing protein [Anaerolineales bacterium]